MITTIPVSDYYELLLYHWLLLCSIQGTFAFLRDTKSNLVNKVERTNSFEHAL